MTQFFIEHVINIDRNQLLKFNFDSITKQINLLRMGVNPNFNTFFNHVNSNIQFSFVFKNGNLTSLFKTCAHFCLLFFVYFSVFFFTENNVNQVIFETNYLDFTVQPNYFQWTSIGELHVEFNCLTFS